MASNSGDFGNIVLKRADPSTIQDKFLVGYQGWFTCPGDGEPIGRGHHGWLHWFNCPIPDGGRPNTDLWPDISSYSPSELFPAPGLKNKSGEQMFLFSSRNPKTVQRHFNWMAKHGVDGAFLQRFAGQCDLESGNEGIRRVRDEVGERVREAAEQEGRVFAIMYDVSGVPPDRIQRILQLDWAHLLHKLRVLDSPNYLREKGKPVVALWGFGFNNAGHTPALVRAIIQFFRNATPGGVYIMGGTPTHWRTAEGDADRDPEFLDVWLNDFDAISPWTVGRYRTEQEADKFAETKMKGDLALIAKRNEEGPIRKIDYIPVVLPGGSGYNLSEGKWGFNDIKREGGRFLWKQIYNARRLGVRTIYGAMWDEYDEGTAFMPVVEHKRNLPQSDKYPFLALDEDGYDVPSDWYMRICGFAAECLRNERCIVETFPAKELQDYWSSRPRYEDVNPKSKEFISESSSVVKADSASDSLDSGDPNSGQTYQEWLALQKEEKDDVPPPPYTLEVDESTDPILSQSVTNTDTLTAVVATAPEVPSVTRQHAPVVANVQPVASSSHAVVSPSAVTNPVELEPTVSAQSPQSYPPIRDHSPHPYPPSGNAQHPQSHSPSQGHSTRPYTAFGASQHPQPHPPTQVYSHPPQLNRPPQVQPYPPISGQHAYYSQYATTQGQLHPVTAQPDQPYLPSGRAQSPHLPGQSPHAHWGQHAQSHSPVGGSTYQGYPTSTTTGAPSQGYIPSNAQLSQSYSTSGGPVHQGYPPVDGSSVQNYMVNHSNQSQDPVSALTDDFGRHNISGPTPRLPTPPPLHPAHPGKPGYRPSRPSTVQPRPNSQSQNRPQTGHRPAAAASSSSAQETQNRPSWPPAEWDLDKPPVPQFSSHPGPGHRPTRPPSRPNMNTPPSEPHPSTHYANSPYLFTGPPMPGPYMPSSSSTNNSVMEGTTMPTIGWPGSRPHSPTVGFPGGQLAYNGPGYGGPSFSSSSSSPTGYVQFPQAEGSYFGHQMPSTSVQGYGSGSESGFPPSAPWTSTGPPTAQFPGPSVNHPSPSVKPSFPVGSGALGFALNAVDKVAGRKTREQLESQVENIAHSGSKLFSKFKDR